MTLKVVIIGVIVATLLSSGIAAASATNEYVPQNGRPAINPDFDPDESCLFDVWQDKCTPGSEQECPEGFGAGGYDQCYPRGGCPEDYHWIEGDESGQCYPDSEGCQEGFVFTNDKGGCVYTTCEGGLESFECISKEKLCATNDFDRKEARDYCFSDEDKCIVQLKGSKCESDSNFLLWQDVEAVLVPILLTSF